MCAAIAWSGVMPAVTTPFHNDLSIDFDFFKTHLGQLIDAGCTGIVLGGSLGEAPTLTFEEKLQLCEAAVAAVGSRAPIVLGISALSTEEGVALAKGAADRGCSGLMVLPPYVYVGDWRETKAHYSAVMKATSLSCMLYNNPVAYKTDILPHQIAELKRENSNLEAVKESSGDIRRLAAIKAETGDDLALFVGIDDVIVEGIAMGAVGWVAGLVSAFPSESVELFNLAKSGGAAKSRALYEWFLPLLRLDTGPKFVQLIKLVQQEVGMGSEAVRPPRLTIIGKEREETLAIVREALAHRPLAAV